MSSVQPETTPWEGSLRGKVTGVTFQSAQGAPYAVFRMEPDEFPPYFLGTREIKVRLQGVAPKPGARVIVKGRGLRHPKYGPQIDASSVEPALDSRDGLLAYLSSGSIAGIGPSLAKAIVGHGGEELFSDPEKLASVKGISKTAAIAMCQEWQSQAQARESVIFLQGLGLGPAAAAATVALWGAQTRGRFAANPYATLLAVRGIGFATADAAALASGVFADARVRLVAAIESACDENLAKRGDTLLAEKLLLERAVHLTQQPLTAVKETLDTVRNLVVVRQSDEVYYSTRLLHNAERAIASSVRRLRRTPPGFKVKLSSQHALSAFEQATGKRLTPEQRAAVDVAIDGKVMILTGGPGVGKTTALFAILDVFEGARIVLCAPSARAARRMQETTGREAATIHRTLKVKSGSASGEFLFEHTESNPLRADLVVVDEASMLDAVLARQLLSALPAQCRLVLVGDPDQLPSVAPGNVFADLIRDGSIPVARLTHIHRQAAGSQIAIQASRIIRGDQIDPQEKGRDFFPISLGGDREASVASARIAQSLITAVSERMPLLGYDPMRDVQVLTPMHQGACGTIALNVALQQKLNPFGAMTVIRDKTWRVGDRVCQTVNNPDLEVFNGDIGVIAGVGRNALEVSFPDGREVVYPDAESASGLMLGYAITIHKAQGSEFRSVVMPVIRSHWNMLDQQILYTGITRGKEAVVLLHEQVALDHAIRTRTGQTRLTALSHLLSESEGRDEPMCAETIR